MRQPRPSRTRRAGVALLVVAIGLALGIAGHFALRAADLADVAASEGDAPAARPATTDPPTTAPPSTTEPPLTTPEPPPTTTTTVVPPTTTTEPPSTTTTTAAGPPTLRRGDAGDEVAALQVRLQELGFWLPAPDGTYGGLTAQAVLAFQKHAGLGRDGIAGPATLAALETTAPVTALEGGDHVEIDLARQLLIVVHGGRTLAFNTSTGAAGWETPTGRFAVTREIDGIRRAPLGDLYRPKYFHRGYAVHGSPSIPGHPASHGCARLHDAAMDLLWSEGMLPVGTPVWVR